jgi:cyanophycinase
VSIHLVGGGWSDDYDGEVYRGFLAEAQERAVRSGRARARVAVLLVREDEETARLRDRAYTELLTRVADCEPVVTAVVEGELFTSEVLSGIDGLLVGGGVTPAYLDAVTPIVEEIRMLVADSLPYLGFSAGAMIAADTSIIGGWQIGDIPVCAESAGEGLAEVTVAQGLGLVDLAIDVHAAQWGTLSRLVAATEAGLVDGGIAIDEYTVLVVGDDTLRVEGRGSVWQVNQHDDGVLVSTLGA